MKETPENATEVLNILIKKLSAKEFKVVFKFLYNLMYLSSFYEKERVYQRFLNKWTDDKNYTAKKSKVLNFKVVKKAK